jgi:methionyl aminopeptidase
VSVGSRKDVQALLAAGRVVAEALARMRALVRPGATTAELDRAAAEVFARHGARSAPQLAYDFPGVTCISVNDEAVHGIPGSRRIAPGDLVKLDVTAELRGYMADAAVTVPVPPVAPQDADLCAAAQAGLTAGIAVARAGATTGAVGAAVEAKVERRGFRVLRELAGHGIGRTIHEPPSVPNFGAAGDGDPLTDGLVITIEPIIASGTRKTTPAGDGWTVATADGGRSAHVEHTIIVRRGRPLILTA